MIKQILRVINEVGVISENEIADAAKTSPAMVQQAIAVLQAKGYLASVSLPPAADGLAAPVGALQPPRKPAIYPINL
jgi:hypothetical protein